MGGGRSPSTCSTLAINTNAEPEPYRHARALLNDRGINPKKQLGQNFLMDGGAASRIAALACGEDDLPIVEIGPGTGFLTQAILSRGRRPELIELDPDMIAILKNDRRFADLPLRCADALTVDYSAIAPDGAWVACGNLPYNIGTPLLMLWVEAAQPPARIVIMLQRDVADRIVAAPTKDNYGSLAVSCQLTMTVRRAFSLKASSFYPRPRIESSVVILERLPEPLVETHLLEPTRLIARAAFAYRRKTLANSLELARGYDRSNIEIALKAAGLGPRARGEEVAIMQFAAVAESLLAQGIEITGIRVDSQKKS